MPVKPQYETTRKRLGYHVLHCTYVLSVPVGVFARRHRPYDSKAGDRFAATRDRHEGYVVGLIELCRHIEH